MKILHIITGLNVGGAENMLAKLIEASPDASTEPVLSLLEVGPLGKRIADAGAPVHSLHMARSLPTPTALGRLASVVRKLRPDVIHGWMYHGNLAANLARYWSYGQPPLIWNIRHSVPDPKLEPVRTRALLAASAPLSRGPATIVYNSAAALTQHTQMGFSGARALVIPNGFDTAVYRPNPFARKALESEFGIGPDTLAVGCIARYHPMKGHDILVESVLRARKRGIDIHLLLVGNELADPPAQLAQRLAELPADRVSTSGARFDVASWLPGLDLVVVPSGWGEGFPNVIGEAMSCSVPVVATDVGDCAQIVGPSGIVVPPLSIDALADALIDILSLSREERSRLGELGRKRVQEQYSIAKVSEEYHALYRRVYACDEDQFRHKVGRKGVSKSGKPRVLDPERTTANRDY